MKIKKVLTLLSAVFIVLIFSIDLMAVSDKLLKQEIKELIKQNKSLESIIKSYNKEVKNIKKKYEKDIKKKQSEKEKLAKKLKDTEESLRKDLRKFDFTKEEISDLMEGFTIFEDSTVKAFDARIQEIVDKMNKELVEYNEQIDSNKKEIQKNKDEIAEKKREMKEN